MTSPLSAFNWRNSESTIAPSLRKTQIAPKSPTPPITIGKRHPLRSSEAQKIGSKSRAPTANISGVRS